MSLGENINRDTSSSSLNRHFLIVPSFNPERRHSWASVVSHISSRNSNVTSFINITNANSIRYFVNIFIMDLYRHFLALPLNERRHSAGPALVSKRVKQVKNVQIDS
ncbi:unnamed protein product [Rotaria magnacalcarata]|uniref:Uncharacterized protein n=1 Tax=Rotaria magnacalcarata TaxID=392030 RepID=A0A8S2PMT1_9BILA|nr:unnamed protein product [Rotaria magnacalcarata]CAF4320177.1 unnamed protein product [Rotaria magnacalcarata]CAF4601981.1 unnamed protein product [Rotaria magnacalcarata]